MLPRKKLILGLLALGLLGFLPLVAVVSPQPQEATIFHAGTRLVEVEVIVRSQPVRPPGVGDWFKWMLDSGPPFGPPGALMQGFTRDDFALFDDGKPQQISLFRAGPGEAKVMSVPPGAFSNRQDSRGEAINGATVLVADFLDTPLDLNDYARGGMTKLLQSLSGSNNRVAVYWLGRNLHVLQDFTDDPRKLDDALAQMDRTPGHTPPALASAFQDMGFLLPQGLAARDNEQITLNAMKVIIQHLAGMPGRKNLVWMRRFPRPRPGQPPLTALREVGDLLLRSNIVLYPVETRSVSGEGNAFGFILEQEHAVEDMAAATGGRAFFDALDLPSALRTAEEDAQGSYLLGYYPAEEMLDGKYHHITVKLKNAKFGQTHEFHYRPGYTATKSAVSPPPPSLLELFNNQFQATNIGLVGRAAQDEQRPGLYEVELTVDLHDIHLEHKDGVFKGAFDLSLPNPSGAHSVQTRTIAINLPEAQLARALESGAPLRFSGIGPQSGEIRVAVRDRATGVAGSLRIPVQTPAAK